MKSPTQIFRMLYGKIRREWKIAFLACFFTGLLVHMPVLLSDIPNHDGLDSMYFDQNMITSGRWFLSVACGFSSYYTIPWVIGILGLLFLSLAAAAMCELLEIRKTWAVVVCSGLLASFPALTSTFAYVYTLDGYMLALLLAVLAVLFTKRFRLGFLPGAFCLAFSMGIYQGYLPFVMILSVYAVLMLLGGAGREYCSSGGGKEAHQPPGREQRASQPVGKGQETSQPVGKGQETSQPVGKGQETSQPVGKGQETSQPVGRGQETSQPVGKGQETSQPVERGQETSQPVGRGQEAARPSEREQETSQLSGKDKRGSENLGKICGILHYLYMGVLGAALYYVILQVLLKLQGKVLDTYQGISDMASGAASGKGIFATVIDMYLDFFRFSLKGNVLFQNIYALTAWVLLGFAALAAGILWIRRRKYWKNPAILVIMVAAVLALPAVTNIILLISPEVNYHLLMRYQWVLYAVGGVALAAGWEDGTGKGSWMEWAALLSAAVLVFCYCITDNIAYSNLHKRYEKTYAYCIRLLDRIEQTEGYYPGIPIAMVGVVGDEQYPVTDITLPVTGGMIGMNGDSLLYRGDNYRLFIRHYLGATLNILPADAMAQMYYSEEYTAMDSFPGKDSIRIIDGIMYIKTENVVR